jgi:integrase
MKKVLSAILSNSSAVSDSSNPPRLLDQVKGAIRLRHYSIRTEQAYVDWIKRFILFHGKRHPKDMGAPEVERFLTYLATECNVAASTQNQALSSLLFLYKEVLGIDLPWMSKIQRAKKPERLPVVLTVEETRRVLARLDGQHGLMAGLLYGAGLRLLECVRLRVKDVDFGYRQITVRDGKGEKDRVTMLPQAVLGPLRAHLDKVKVLHEHHDDLYPCTESRWAGRGESPGSDMKGGRHPCGAQLSLSDQSQKPLLIQNLHPQLLRLGQFRSRIGAGDDITRIPGNAARDLAAQGLQPGLGFLAGQGT